MRAKQILHQSRLAHVRPRPGAARGKGLAFTRAQHIGPGRADVCRGGMRVNTQHSFYVGETLLNLSEIVIKPSSILAGWTVESVESKLDLSVIFQPKPPNRRYPSCPERPTARRDKILVLASVDALQQLNALNQDPE